MVEQYHGAADRKRCNPAWHHVEITREIIGRGCPQVGSADAERIGDLLVVGTRGALHRRDDVATVRQAERETLNHCVRVKRQSGSGLLERGDWRMRMQLKRRAVV